MNKQRHRIVFNRARGTRIAVQETATSAGKGTGSTTLGTAMAAAILAMGTMLPAQAAIVAATNVSPGLQPQVLTAANGVPVVNIRTPYPSGVVFGVYSQFDVGSNGVVLNNYARTGGTTQLAGNVAANPYLSVPAKVIVNQINSNRVNTLAGPIEVAGAKAEVVVSNPAGITLDGASFINANGATLTTGTPLFANGVLSGYQVRGGVVTVARGGLDARSTDYVSILAAATQVNSNLIANNLRVVNGVNNVSADGSKVTPISGAPKSTGYELDVAEIGGMYANTITLVGTQDGLGVRNAGYIGSLASSIAKTQVNVASASGFVNSGKINSDRIQVQVGGAGAIVNTGVIGQRDQSSKVDLKAGSINNAGGAVSAVSSVLTATGDINNTSGNMHFGDLDLEATGVFHDNFGGFVTASGSLLLKANQLDLSGGTVVGGSVALTAGQGGILNRDKASIQSLADMTINSGSAAAGYAGLDNSTGSLSAAGNIAVNAGAVVNNGATIVANSLSIDTHGQSLSNRDTKYTSSGPSKGIISREGLAQIVAGDIDNRSGVIEGRGLGAVVNAANINNQDGRIVAPGGALNITTTGHDNSTFDNQNNGVVSASNLSLQSTNILNNRGNLGIDPTHNAPSSVSSTSLISNGSIDNTNGTIVGGNSLTIKDTSPTRSLSFINTTGHITSYGDLDLGVAKLSGDGWIKANRNAKIDVDSSVANTASIDVGGDLRYSVKGDFTNYGRVNAGGDLSVRSVKGSISNTADAVLRANTLTLDSDQFIVNRGSITGDKMASLKSLISVRNTAGGAIAGNRIGIKTLQLMNTSEANVDARPSIVGGQVDIGATYMYNTFANINAVDLAIGGDLDGNGRATGKAYIVDNRNGIFDVTGKLSVNATFYTPSTPTRSPGGALISTPPNPSGVLNFAVSRPTPYSLLVGNVLLMN